MKENSIEIARKKQLRSEKKYHIMYVCIVYILSETYGKSGSRKIERESKKFKEEVKRGRGAKEKKEKKKNKKMEKYLPRYLQCMPLIDIRIRLHYAEI